MKGAPDITVTVNFHREGAYALSALASLADLVAVARQAGLTVETQAVLDCPDELTRHIVDVRGRWIDRVEEVSLGDLGLSRNAGTELAHGRFLAFLDGDDLWGEHWLRAAFEAATRSGAPHEQIWHPEHHYAFTETDLYRMPEGRTSAYTLLQGSDTRGFDPWLLAFESLWSANAFAAREVYARFPYCAADRNRGLGIEDWSWHLATVWAGIHHRVVPGAVHLIRRKGLTSLQQQNTAQHLLCRLPTSLRWGTVPSPFERT
jgi:hypothetical protein